MSVNIDLTFTVTGLTGEAQTKAVAGAIEELLRDERIDDQVSSRWTLKDGHFLVSGETDFSLSISRFYLWGPEFESSFESTVSGVAPEAKSVVTWGYPDHEF